jgi:[Skp1-protein]-hydroxyproline N-acetylglucosaminyltransferase
MCNSDFEGIAPARYLRHGSQPEDYAIITDMPQLQPFWAAGFSFSRGHFKVLVPYDGYQPMVFQGEEIAIGIRGFTYGYDFYAPKQSVVFHEYAEKSSRRKKIHMFWENSEKHKGEGKKSLMRSMTIIGMARDIDPAAWDHSEIDKYGLGKGKREYFILLY